MQQRIDVITLGVPDLAAARRFYLDGLGWTATLDMPDEVVFLQVGHGVLLALFSAAALDADAGVDSVPAPAASLPISLGQVVDTEQEVLDTLDRAAAAGGTVLKAAQRAAFGGFHGYFADPVGFRWEVATNPGWSVDPDGHVTIVPVA